MQITNNIYSYKTASSVSATNSNKARTTVKTDKTTETEKRTAGYGTTEKSYDTYTKEGLTRNTVTENDSFPDCNPIQSLAKYVKAFNEHYEKVNEENKKFADPKQHIMEKYYNKKSPYYVEGLTNAERKICVENETNILEGYDIHCLYDPADMEEYGGSNVFVSEMEYNQETRDAINDVVNQLFRKNGIVISEDTALRLTVDPYDYYIHAEGVDEEMAGRIEAALNQGKNGYNLYQHIYSCNPQNYNETPPDQYLQGDREKMVLYHFVDKLTGLDLRKLENRDGKYYTPDGEELWSVLEKKYADLVAENKADAFGLGEYKAAYDRIAKNGWDKSTDCNLSLDYKNEYLCDIDMEHGYGQGQSEWQNRVREWYDGVKAEEQKRRKETILREANEPTAAESLNLQEDNQQNVWEKVFGTGKNSAASEAFAKLVRGDADAIQRLLNQLWEEGKITPITNEIISLPQEKKVVQGFDFKV